MTESYDPSKVATPVSNIKNVADIKSPKKRAHPHTRPLPPPPEKK